VVNEPMAQDETTVQELSPQPNSESEMGAVAGTADERPPCANPPTDRMMEMFEALMNNMDTNTRESNAKMDTNARESNDRMDANMQTLRGEMQDMGLNLQAGQKAVSMGIRGIMAIARGETRTVEHKMAVPRVGANELGGSVDCVGRPMETSEVVTRDAVTTCRVRLVEVTTMEKLMVTETRIIKGETNKYEETTQELKEITEKRTTKTTEIKTETREIEGELDDVIDEHTQVEIVEDNGGELAECVVAQCEQKDGLLQEQGEGKCPLEAEHDQVGSVEPCEVEGASTVNGYTRSLGGYGGPGSACGSANPQRDCSGVCAYECGEMRVETCAWYECSGVHK